MSDESILEETWGVLRSILGLHNRPRHLKTNPPMDMLRPDGSRKGPGWLGTLKDFEGEDVSEITAGTPGKDGGIFPMLVPTLSPGQVNRLIGGGGPTSDMYEKAVSHSKNMKQQGKSPFAPGGFKTDNPYGPKAKEKPEPLKRATHGLFPGTFDNLQEEQDLASDDQGQIAAKLEAYLQSNKRGSNEKNR